jgi:hypothetical protein
MPLADDIRMLRDRVLLELVAAHDYHAETEIAWRIVRKVVATGARLRSTNKVTGTTITQAHLVAKSEKYVSEQLAAATFQQFLSIFESFFFDFLRLWLTAYPRSLSGKKIDLKAILDAPDKDAIVQLAVGRELNEVLYERPAAWFAYLEDKVNLGCPSADEIDRIAEAKASRDALIHNRGVAGKLYSTKAGRLARHHEGDFIDISELYHRQTWELLRKVVADVSDAAVAKAPLAE